MPHLENLLERFQREYYTNLLLCFVEVAALIAGVVFARKYKIGRYFIFYISFELSILLADFYLYSISGDIITPFEHFFINLSNALISLVELFVYYYFFSK